MKEIWKFTTKRFNAGDECDYLTKFEYTWDIKRNDQSSMPLRKMWYSNEMNNCK